MVTADRVFNAAIALGLMILFSMFVEWFASTYILKRAVVSWLFKGVGALLGLALLVFGIARLGAPSGIPSAGGAPVSNVLGLVFGAGLAAVFVITSVAAFMSRRIGPAGLALNVIAFFAAAIIAYLTLRPLIPVETLADNDIVFVCVTLALVVIGLGNLMMRPVLAENKAPDQLPINPQADALSFGEKRRQRLNKRRSRR